MFLIFLKVYIMSILGMFSTIIFRSIIFLMTKVQVCYILQCIQNTPKLSGLRWQSLYLLMIRGSGISKVMGWTICATWYWHHSFSPLAMLEDPRSSLTYLAPRRSFMYSLLLHLGSLGFLTRWSSPTLLTWQLASKGNIPTAVTKESMSLLRPKLEVIPCHFWCLLLSRSVTEPIQIQEERK